MRLGARLAAVGVTPSNVLVALVAAHLLVKLALFWHLADAPLVGDEAAYVDGARALSNAVRDLSGLGSPDSAELQRSVIGSGWFMPGMSVLLTPLLVVDPDASVTSVRAFLGVVTSVLLLLSVISVRRVLGDLYAGALLVFPGLVPMWLLFSYSAWGDLCAGLVLVLLLVQVVEMVRGLRAGIAPGWREGVRFGLVAIAVVYLRSSTVVIILGLGAFVLATACWVLVGRERWRSVVSMGVAGLAFGAVLLPWSVAASQTLGDRVVTTTSVPVVRANTFGDPSRLCFGPCDPGSTIWFNPLRYSREVARATGYSEIEVQKQMSAYARADVTSQSYARDVLANLGRYIGDPAGFAAYLQPPDAPVNGAVERWVTGATRVLFFGALAVAAGMLLAVFRGPLDSQVLSLVHKLGFGALLTQPFVHLAGGRYWTTAAPLLGLSVALLVDRLRIRGAQPLPDPVPEEAGATAVLGRWLTGAQVALAAAVVATGVVVCALAA